MKTPLDCYSNGFGAGWIHVVINLFPWTSVSKVMLVYYLTNPEFIQFDSWSFISSHRADVVVIYLCMHPSIRPPIRRSIDPCTTICLGQQIYAKCHQHLIPTKNTYVWASSMFPFVVSNKTRRHATKFLLYSSTIQCKIKYKLKIFIQIFMRCGYILQCCAKVRTSTFLFAENCMSK